MMKSGEWELLLSHHQVILLIEKLSQINRMMAKAIATAVGIAVLGLKNSRAIAAAKP
jgi:hypothetical protein